ncbi:hypothetical protein IFT84_13810 [Rhizobium sp. CFBP 8762]|uniref:hypothetical protein n=1 Tax=Rhizobium sp. CFBP 8762 TaxID=2775279 RepID=UPI0017832A4A|nr:hypothetical protein [Rhizobium sp. CFBP 8762]MBD8555583.1 hypothetical protein [Rhizobium sp. CFBP 8762]
MANRKFLIAVAAFVCLLKAAPSQALTFSTKPFGTTTTLIVASGVFEPNESYTDFLSLVRGLGDKSGFVVFNSPGGNPSKAIELGRLIRSLGLATYQIREMQCVSACALAFMGGISRGAETGSIGVHKSSFSDTTALSVDDAVSYIQHQTAETMMYLTEMGVDPALLQLSLQYERDDMRYLSKSEMVQYRVTTLDIDAVQPTISRDVAAVQPEPAAKALPGNGIAAADTRFQIPLAKTGVLRVPKGKEFLRVDENQDAQKTLPLHNGDRVRIVQVNDRWYRVEVDGVTGYLHHNWVKVDQFFDQPFGNRYIQIKSFDNFNEAAWYAQNSTLPLTVYLATNRWFAVALNRTMPQDEARDELKSLKEQGLVPDDAFMTVGNTYVRTVCCTD